MKQILACKNCQRNLSDVVSVIDDAPTPTDCPDEVYTKTPASPSGIALRFSSDDERLDYNISAEVELVIWFNVSDVLPFVTSKWIEEYTLEYVCSCGEIIGHEQNVLFQYFQPEKDKTFFKEFASVAETDNSLHAK